MYGNRRTSASALPSLPPGAQRTAVYSDAYTVEVTPPAYEQHLLQNPWDLNTPPLPPPRPRVRSMNESRTHYGQNQVPYDSMRQQRMPFPEPVFYGQQNNLPTSQQRLAHHHSRSELGVLNSSSNDHRRPHNDSVSSFASSYNAHNDYLASSKEGAESSQGDLKKSLADLSLTSDEALHRFQSGQLPENEQEWHRLVPPEARDALGKQEVQRQSVIFEVIKSEREYVADLEAVQDIFIKGLREVNPPILREPRLSAFVNEVFGNLAEIVTYHQRLLAALFARQREQHPLIQSVADIFLDITLKSDFRSTYEVYIKRYPLAESYHRKQLKSNHAYEIFVQSASEDHRIRKRDLITFLSRPVTKLPRLMLLLSEILKLTETEYDHPDLETLPIVLSILKDCVKSTQPGIEAAESKVKFWGICESLVFQKGEIIDMDLYDDSRSLAYSGSVLRRGRTETGFSEKWADLVAALLDNYFILAREEKHPNGSVKRVLMSRPMPLSFLRLGSFTAPPETRKERTDEGGGLLDSFRSQNVPIYPFTIFHAGNKATRYTLYVNSDAQRKKWYNAFVDAIGVHKVRQEANMWFNPQTLTDGFFRSPQRDPSKQVTVTITGRISCTVPFTYGSLNRRYLAVGCGTGIYVGPTTSEKFQRILNYRNATALAALTTLGVKEFNRLVIHAESSLVSCSLGSLVGRLAGPEADKRALETSVERVVGSDTNVTFFKHVHVAGRSMLVVSSKRKMATSLNLQVFEAVSSSELLLAPRRPGPATTQTFSFRPYGQPGYIPKDANDIAGLSKTIGVCTNTGIVTLDPTNISDSPVTIVPEFRDVGSHPPMASLKERVEGLKPLGYVTANANEFLVIYDEIGFYINKRGVPVRHSGYIKWEVKATSYAYRNGHVMLISPAFIEIRNITTSRIVQVIEGEDMRLLYAGPYMTKDDPVLIVMRGGKDDKGGVSEKIVEMTETQEIGLMSPTNGASAIWDEWDM